MRNPRMINILMSTMENGTKVHWNGWHRGKIVMRSFSLLRQTVVYFLNLTTTVPFYMYIYLYNVSRHAFCIVSLEKIAKYSLKLVEN